MKIGTLSFELKGEEMALSGLDRIKIILEVAKTYRPDFILCSGYSLENNENLIELESKLKEQDNKTTILVEVKNDIDIQNNGHPVKDSDSTHKMFIIDPKSGIKELGVQFFSTSEELDKDSNRILLKEFEKHFDSRIFNIGDYKAIALCCGELNVFKGIICRSKEVERKIFDADIIVNPTHDRMGNGGKLKTKRENLSKQLNNKNRCYISSSNWNTQKKRSDGKIISQQPSLTLHTIYINSIRQEMKQCHKGKYEFRLLDTEGL